MGLRKTPAFSMLICLLLFSSGAVAHLPQREGGEWDPQRRGPLHPVPEPSPSPDPGGQLEGARGPHKGVLQREGLPAAGVLRNRAAGDDDCAEIAL